MPSSFLFCVEIIGRLWDNGAKNNLTLYMINPEDAKKRVEDSDKTDKPERSEETAGQDTAGEQYWSINKTIEKIESDERLPKETRVKMAEALRQRIKSKLEASKNQLAADLAKIKTARELLGIDTENQNDLNQEKSAVAGLEQQFDSVSELVEEIAGPKSKQEESKEKEEFIRRDIDDLREDLDRLSAVLKKRQDYDLNPLIYEEDATLFRSASQSLAESVQKQRIDFTDIEDAIKGISKAARGFGEPRSNNSREDLDSLKQVDFAVREVFGKLNELRKKLGQSENDEAKSVADRIDKTLDSLDDVGVFLTRKISSLREYLG